MARELRDFSDEELMLAYAAGDASAFEVLYARHEAGMFRFVSRLLGSSLAAQVEAVFQDAWGRIIAGRKAFLPQSARWRTWALTLAYQAALDRLRIRDASTEPAFDDSAPLDWLVPALGAPTSSADDGAHWHAAGQKLLQCLELLPAAQRAAFLLHHEDGASLEDLARRLDLPLETVSSRLRGALQKIHGCMGGYLTDAP